MTGKQTVNPWFLITIVEPFVGMADEPDAVDEYSSLDPNDEAAVRSVIARMVVPHLNRLTDDSAAKLKTTTRYYLSYPALRNGVRRSIP